MNTMQHLTRSLALAVLVALPMASQAEEWIRPGTETWLISGGVFLPEFDTNIRVNNTNLDAGAGVNLEDKLSLEKRNETSYFDLKWRFFERHRLGVSYFRFKRDASATASQDIQIGDGTIIEDNVVVHTDR